MFISPAHSLFNCFSCVLLNYFACVWLNNIDNLIYIVTIFLTISLTPIFLLRNYTGTNDGNVCNAFKMFSAMFRIRCTIFRFFIITVSMFSYVSVYVMILFYIRFVHIHNILHFTDGHLLWCAHLLIIWMKKVLALSIYTKRTIMWFLFLFRHARILFSSLLPYKLEFYLCLFASLLQIIIILIIYNSFPFIEVIPYWIVSLTFPIVLLTYLPRQCLI